MRKLLLLTLLGILSFQVKAFTVSELDGKMAAQCFYGNDAQAGLGIEHYAGYFELRNGTLYIVNFKGEYDLPVTVNSAGNIILTSQTTVTSKLDSTKQIRIRTAELSSSSARFSCNDNSCNKVHNGYGYGFVSTNLTSTNIYESFGNGGFNTTIFTFGDDTYILGIETIVSGTVQARVHFYTRLRLEVYDTNASASAYYNNSLSSSYNLLIQEYEGALYFANLTNNGILFYNDDSTGSWKIMRDHLEVNYNFENYSLTLPACYVGGYVSFRKEFGWYYAQYNSWGRYYYVSTTGSDYAYWIVSTERGYQDDVLCGKNFADNITGTFEPSKLTHNITNSNDRWINNGGSLTTAFRQIDIHLNDMYIHTYDYTDNAIAEVPYMTDKTDISWEGPLDYTHDCGIELTAFSWEADKGIRVKGNIVDRVNNAYVKSYDVMMVKGNISTVSGRSDLSSSLGLTSAVELTSDFDVIWANGVNARAESSDAPVLTFEKYLTNDDLAALDLGDNQNKNYTLFLRTNYNNGLEPTYHALTPLGDKISTGVETVETYGGKVYAKGGEIVVEGYEGVVEVYTTSGAQVYAGTDTRIAVAPGMYIVRCGNRNQKVVVR